MSYEIDSEIYRGYKIVVEAIDDGWDVENPLKDWDGAPSLVLHERAESNFGWTNDDEWFGKLNTALDRLAASTVTKDMYGPTGALAVIDRWMRVFYGAVVLPVGAGQHSGTWVYLGTGASFGDPGGWDSGWVGWLFATEDKVVIEWGNTDWDAEQIEKDLIGSFKEFAAWVANDVFAVRVLDQAGMEDEDEDDGDEWTSLYGIINSDRWRDADGDVRLDLYHQIDHRIEVTLYEQAMAEEVRRSEIEAHEHNDRFALYRGLVSS